MKKVFLSCLMVTIAFFANAQTPTSSAQDTTYPKIKEKFIVETELMGPMTFGTDGRYFYLLNCLSNEYELTMSGKELTKGLRPIAVAKAESSDEYQEGPARFVMLIYKDKDDKVHQAYYDYLYHVVSFAENEFK